MNMVFDTVNLEGFCYLKSVSVYHNYGERIDSYTFLVILLSFSSFFN